MGTRGGKREGAGRPVGATSLHAEKVRAHIAEQIALNIEPITKAFIKKSKSGDVLAFRELVDRGFGKAPQSIAIDQQGTMTIVFDDSFNKKNKK